MSGSGTILFITPTYGVLMGGLAIARIPYITWLKFIAPLVAFFVLLNSLALSIGAAL